MFSVYMILAACLVSLYIRKPTAVENIKMATKSHMFQYWLKNTRNFKLIFTGSDATICKIEETHITNV